MHLTRRELMARACFTDGAALHSLNANPSRVDGAPNFTSRRPPASQRKFTSKAVDETIARVKRQIQDPKLAWLFENCFPNTLDTTVNFNGSTANPDTFVITGDIDAMWLRDSSAQIWPYLPLAKQDVHLRTMLAGVIRRQSRCILIDPYANAFLPDKSAKPLPWAVHDRTEHKPGVGERKWEVDSLCYPIRMAYGYWKHTGRSMRNGNRRRKPPSRALANSSARTAQVRIVFSGNRGALPRRSRWTDSATQRCRPE